MVADTPAQPIPVKTFCCRLVSEPALSGPLDKLPVIREVSEETLMANYELIRSQVEMIVQGELQRIADSPELGHVVL